MLLKLILAHVLGDFLLQPGSWVKAKLAGKIRSYQLYLHIVIHFVLTMLLVWDWDFWPWAILISGSHLLIDSIKLYLQNEKINRLLFFADQFSHILILVIIAFAFDPSFWNSWTIDIDVFLLWATALFILTQPLSIAIKTFISKWTPYKEDKEADSLEDAGQYIGYLERLLVFIFILSDHWEAVGFLITAKSVFRFGDLKDSKDRKLTEYVLIGTLGSFGLAVVAALFFKYIITLL